MKIRFQDGTIMEAKDITEQKLFQAGKPYGWLLSIVICGNLNSEELDNCFKGENISSIRVLREASEKEIEIAGYKVVNNILIRHDEKECFAEIQLTKQI